MSEFPKPHSELEAIIKYEFRHPEYLRVALTHSSYSHEQRIRRIECRCNERLEFLGDAVLALTSAELLFARYGNRDEGDLTKLRAEIVCERALAGFAASIELGDYLYLGVGEDKNGGRESKSILSDAFEALLAAIYLDAAENGLSVVKAFLLPFLSSELDRYERVGRGHDYKTQLQQFIQQDSSAKLQYVTVAEDGPDHNKTFRVEARMGSNIIGRGVGKTKREAEQNAAREALTLFGEIKG